MILIIFRLQQWILFTSRSSSIFFLKQMRFPTFVNAIKRTFNHLFRETTRSQHSSLQLFKKTIFFCVLKKFLHYTFNQCVRPSDRLHDNFAEGDPIVMEFCSQNCLIDISFAKIR